MEQELAHHRANQGMAGITTVPLGYVDFSFRWNDYAFPGDARRFSAVYLADEPEDTTVQISTCPVQLHEFLDCPRAGPEDRGPRSDPDRPCRSGGPGQKLADRPPVKRARASSSWLWTYLK